VQTIRGALPGVLAALSLAVAAHASPPPRGFSAGAEAIIQRHLAAGDFSGVVLIADHGKPVFRKAYGLANREWNIANAPDTVFRIGSTTKTFTAAAILKLAEAGKLKLDDPISKYDQRAPTAWSGVTLRHLLNHSSGIPDFVSVSGFIRGPARLDSPPEALVDLVRDKPLEFAPGSKFHYSNTGYVLLGLVIEKVSGESYADYRAESLLKPFRLDHTAYDHLDEVLPGRAQGYWRVDGVWKNARPWATAAAYATGDLRSTADDMLAWDQALHTGKVLSPASFADMFTDAGHGYGLGSFIETRHGHRLWDHGGNLTGFCSASEYYPDDGVTVIVLNNVEGTDAEKLSKELAGLYFGWPAKP
jgi:CubicO group peptidase (beta-lactamase class C family)